jgi:hypothetical protein
MNELPFEITQEAEAQIERVLLVAQRDLKLLAMARVLSYATSCSWTNPEGGGGWYPFPHVVCGWHPFDEVVGNSEYMEFELAGFRVFADQGTLGHLRGKRIVLDKGSGMAGRDMLAVKGPAASWGER